MESKRLLQSTLDALASHIAVLNESGEIIAVNKAWQQFADENEGTLVTCGIGSDYIEICAKAQGDCATEALTVAEGIRDVIRGNQSSFSLEYPCHSPTQQRWFNVSITRFLGDEPIRVVVAHENISDRKQAQETLWQSELQFRAIFDNSLDGIIITDDDGRFLEVNEAACQIYGVSRQQILGMNVSDFAEPTWNYQQEALAFRIAGQKKGEHCLVLRDGTKKYVEFASTANFSQGRHLSTLRDITERKYNVEAIRTNEERLRFVTDNARVGLVMVNQERRYSFANITYAEILGLPSANIVGLRVEDVLAPLYENQIRPRLDRAFSGERVVYELRLPTSEGDRYFMVKYEPTKVEGKVTLVVVVITDITERKQAEESVREGETRIAGIVNAAMDAIITIDASQRIILFNPAAERMFGHEREAVLGQSINCLIPERFRAVHGEHIRLFGQRGMTSRKMGALGALSGVRSNGEEFPIEASISQIEIAGQKLFTVILRDITERKQAEAALHQAHDNLEKRVEERTEEIQKANETLRIEGIERKMAMDALRESSEALRETQQMLQVVMNHIPQAIFWKDRNSVYLGCNYRFVFDAGYNSPEELIGKRDTEMPWAEYAADYRSDDVQVMESDTPKLNIEEPFVGADGNPAWLRTTKIPLHDAQNNVVGVLCSYEDITDQKLAETALIEARREADAANHAKSEFLSRMSHELRTPLNAILGFGQILDKEELNSLSKESVGYILKGGRHLLDLINEILDIARVEAGRLEISLEPIALNDIIPEACALLRSLAAERHIQLRENTAELSSSYVLADRQRLKQVLLNLLANGIKYNIENGAVEIHCELENEGWISIAVRDTGPGISPQNLKKLFTPFERLTADTSEIEGTGLGLVLAQRLMTAMGGTLEVESIVSQGTTFTIKLPQAIPPEGSFIKEVEASPFLTTIEPSERQYTVLCIEDNPSNLRFIEVILKRRPDIALLEAIQGSVGLDLARQHEPDLILLDLNLPDMHGRDVLARLQQSALTRDIPVIVVSADATSNQIERLMDAGVKAYLTKPLDVLEFFLTLDQFLKPTNNNEDQTEEAN